MQQELSSMADQYEEQPVYIRSKRSMQQELTSTKNSLCMYDLSVARNRSCRSLMLCQCNRTQFRASCINENCSLDLFNAVLSLGVDRDPRRWEEGKQ